MSKTTHTTNTITNTKDDKDLVYNLSRISSKLKSNPNPYLSLKPLEQSYLIDSLLNKNNDADNLDGIIIAHNLWCFDFTQYMKYYSLEVEYVNQSVHSFGNHIIKGYFLNMEHIKKYVEKNKLCIINCKEE